MKLDYLDPVLHETGPWASVYFGTARATQDATQRQELQARGVCERLAGQGADDATCRAVYDGLAVSTPDRAGQALFATGGRVRLAVPLATAPPAPESCWTALPHITPLLDYAGGGEAACLVAYIDRTGADLDLWDVGGRHPAGQVRGRDWPVHRTPSSDWSERHFQLAVENTWEENAAVIAAAMTSAAERTGAELLLLAGDPRERRAVHDRLPPQLRAGAVETDRSGRAAGADRGPAVAEADRLREEYGQEVAREVLEQFRAARVPADGRVGAAEGVPALVDAAREHRIDTLLVRSGGTDLHRDVWVGSEPDQLAERRTETAYLGDTRPAAARADDALLRSATAADAEVVHLPDGDRGGPGSDVPVGGLGALLRWPYEGGIPGGGLPPAV